MYLCISKSGQIFHIGLEFHFQDVSKLAKPCTSAPHDPRSTVVLPPPPLPIHSLCSMASAETQCVTETIKISGDTGEENRWGTHFQAKLAAAHGVEGRKEGRKKKDLENLQQRQS